MGDYNLGTARGRIEIDAAGVGKGLSDANRQLDTFEGKSKATSANLQKTGVVMLGAAGVIAGGFALAINSAADFEKVISGIAAVSGATEPELEKVRKKALQLGADTQYSAGEAATAMEELIKAGLSVDDVLNGAADATVNLAAAGEIALPEAATIAANAMNGFGLAAADMPHVADLIAGAANASAIDVGEFGQALQQSAAVAHLAGISFDDLSVAIAEMGNAGIKGSDAGTSLKTFLQNLIPVTDKQIGLSKELGLITADGANAFFDASGKAKSLAEISGVLQGALKGQTKEQQLLTLQTLFGSDAIRAAAVLADQGADGFNNMATSMGKVSAADVAAKRMDNLSGSIEQLKGSVETLMIIIGRPLADSLRTVVDLITKMVNWIGALDPSTLNMVVTIAKMVAAFLGIIGAGLMFIAIIDKITKAWAALQLVMEANPVILIITAIIALGAALYILYQRNETFRNAVQALFGWMHDNVLPVIEAIIKGFKEFWTVLSTGMTENEGGSWWENLAFVIRDVAHWIQDVLIPALITFAGWIDTAAQAVGGWEVVLKLAGVALVLLVAPLAAIVAGVIYAYTHFGWFKKAVDEVVERLVSGFDWVKSNVWPVLFALGELVAAIGERIVKNVQFMIGIFQDLVGVIKAMGPLWKAMFLVLRKIIEVFVGIIQNLWNNFGDNIFHVIEITFGLIKQAVESTLRVLQGIIQVVTSLIKGDWQGAWEGIKNIFGGVWDFIKYLPGAVLDFIITEIQTAFDVVLTIFQNIDTVLRAVFGGLWQGLKDIVVGAIDAIIGFIADIPGRLAGFVDTIFDGLLNAARNVVDAVVGFFEQLPEDLRRGISVVLSVAGEIGGAIRDGIINGVTGVISAVGDIATQLKDTIWNAIKGLINTGINAINDMIPNEIGGFDIPGPGPDFPSINLPDNPIPTLHSGGIFPGQGEGLALLQGGEGVMSRDMMKWFSALLNTMGSSASDFFGGTLPSFTAAPSSGGLRTGARTGDLTLTLVFPNVGSAKDADEIKRTLKDPSVLSQLSRAITAGVGRNN